MFIALSLNRHYAAEEHPEFETVEFSRRRLRDQAALEAEEAEEETELEVS